VKRFDIRIISWTTHIALQQDESALTAAIKLVL